MKEEEEEEEEVFACPSSAIYGCIALFYVLCFASYILHFNHLTSPITHPPFYKSTFLLPTHPSTYS